MRDLWNKFSSIFRKEDNTVSQEQLYKFGVKSTNRLLTCDFRLQEILNEAIKIVDFSVICGYRDKEAQNTAYFEGKSKLQYPDSKHNTNPSKAVDVAPYPIDWNDTERFAHLVGILKGIAHSKGYTLRLGIDWDMDGDITDHAFMDYPHIEIID